MSQTLLSADTEVILLLCGRFGGERQDPFQPLSARDYGEFAKWLNARGLRPADLMTAEGQAQLQDAHQAKLDGKRLEFLLTRGTAMALALERWNRSGLWVISRGDLEFPKRLKHHLRHAAPPLLYGAGSMDILNRGGLAIIGSRDASESALEFTRDVATECAHDGLSVVSGGARGVDTAAMQGAIDAGGCAIGVLANDLLKASVHRQNRMGLQSGRLVLVSPFYPEAAFNAGNAMGRNKYIYALSDRALVIDSALGSGGTWEGATEALNRRWVPVYVRTPGQGAGNAALISNGALPFDFLPGQGISLSDVFTREESNISNNSEPDATLHSLLDSAQADGVPESKEAKEHQEIAKQDGEDIAPLGATEAPAAELTLTEPTEPQVAAQTEPLSAANSLDMYQDFLVKVSLALGSTPLSEDLLATCLGLEKSQAKAWLARALSEQRVEKLKKPVRYALRSQSSLIG
jgi:predicted Rossmann fold nucleotide-binding protein DprA/Smf involved in DNA uptake